MPATLAFQLGRLDDNLKQHVLSLASLPDIKALSLTCRSLCQLARRARPYQLFLTDKDLQTLAALPEDRAHEWVQHIHLKGGTHGALNGITVFGRLCRVIGLAVQRWPGVERVTLEPGWCAITDSGQYGYLMGAVVLLQGAPALRSLTLHRLADSYSLQYLQLLTQLTELHVTPVAEHGAFLAVGGHTPRAFLSECKGLRALCLSGDTTFRLCQGDLPTGVDLPLVLPPNLTRLEARVPRCQPGMFWRHMAACTHLVSLTVHQHTAEDAADHPSWMLACLADSLQNLRHFHWHGRGVAYVPSRMSNLLGRLAGTAAAQQQLQEQGWDWAQLSGGGHSRQPLAPQTMIPAPNLGRLASLQTLEVRGWQLACCGPHHWHALAACKALRRLEGLQGSLPPSSVKFPGVTRLGVAFKASLDVTLGVLQAFPALQQLQVEVWLEAATEGQQQQGQQEGQQQRQVTLSSLTRACIHLCRQGVASRSYYSALWRAMPGLQHLELTWPLEADFLPQLPGLSAFQGLTSLILSSSGVLRDSRLTGVVRQRVGLQALLEVLQGATRLEALQLHLEVGNDSRGRPAAAASKPQNKPDPCGLKLKRISMDWLVMDLQRALPRLRHLLLGEKEEVERWRATTAAVRPGLKVGPAW